MKITPNYYWPILLIASLFFFLFLGKVHLFDWDEITFAECAREMLLTNNFLQVQIDFAPFYEKPPLFIWLQALSMKLLGVGEYAARLPDAIFGLITLMTLYCLGKRHHSSHFGFIWALLYFGSLLPHLYFKSGIIDPVFNYFIFLSIYFLIRTIEEAKLNFAIAAGIANGLAILTKGPVGFLLLFLTFAVYLVINRFRLKINLLHVLAFAFSIMATAAIWYIPEIIVNGTDFIYQFIVYQIDLFRNPVAGHQQGFYYHFVVVFFGCFPMSIFALPSFFRKYEEVPLDMRRWMLCLFWVVMILFTIVTTKIVHYSSMAYLPLSYLAALYVHDLWQGKQKLLPYVQYFLIGIGGILALAISLLPVVGTFKEKLYRFIQDDFAVACLKTDVHWSLWISLIGLFYFAAIIVAIKWIKQEKVLEGLMSLAFGLALMLLLALQFIVPKIESYSQGPAIAFFESLKGQPVYTSTFGYKSYVPYFYFDKQAQFNPESRSKEWLLEGPIDQPAYFIIKSTKKHKIAKYQDLQFLDQKGGFLLYRRMPHY